MKWYIGAALLLAAAFLLESSLLAFATYALLGALIGSRFLTRSWLNHVSASRTCEVVSAEVGDAVTLRLQVTNNGSLPIPWLILEDVVSREALIQRPPRLRVQGKRVKIMYLPGGAETTLRYTLTCSQRGYYQLGPLVLEGGDVFGLHRRFRVLTEPHFLLVYPRVVTLEGYELASRRPIGEVVLMHRLYEDPTRISGVRPYEAGDPLNRVHWRATARTGQLHSKMYEATTLIGATVLLDFHADGFFREGEPYRSELAILATCSLAHAVFVMGQQVGLVTNARDAADRIRREGWQIDPQTRQSARSVGAMNEASTRLEPVVVETRRGVEQFQRIREVLGRAEQTDGMTFSALVLETAARLPRDATVVAVLPDVSVESAVALGNLKRQGYAMTVVLIAMDANTLEKAHGRLLAEGIRDVRHLTTEAALPSLCRQQVYGRGQFAEPLEAPTEEPWLNQRAYELDSPEE